MKDERWVYYSQTNPEYPAEGVTKRVLAYTDELMLVENKFETGAIGSMHSHPHTQITYIVSGKFEFTIGEERHIVSAGDTLLKKDGVIHGCTCLEEGILLDTFSPMREDFIK